MDDSFPACMFKTYISDRFPNLQRLSRTKLNSFHILFKSVFVEKTVSDMSKFIVQVKVLDLSFGGKNTLTVT